MSFILDIISSIFKALFSVIWDRQSVPDEAERASSDFGDTSADHLHDSLSGFGSEHNADSGDSE